MPRIEQRDKGHLIFKCPGCKRVHNIYYGEGAGFRWEFNGDFERPAFSPSILIRGYNKQIQTICHSFIVDGNIQFLSDCTHELKGQTVPLPEIE